MILSIAVGEDAAGLAAMTPWIKLYLLASCIPDWHQWPVEQLIYRASSRR